MLDSLPPTDPDTDADPFDRPGRFLEPTIRKAANLAIVRVLVEAGANLNDISDAMRAELTGLKTGSEIVCSNRHYAEGRNGRFGNANPEVMDIPFWRAMVQSGATAFAARDAFDDLRGRAGTPVWSHHRFGKSSTELPDGRIIEIAGSHDVSHTPDFCIYNEVVVHRGDGQFDIYGYPEPVFPPTDFHSATLVGNEIYIIGCLGYPESRRPGETPVYRLNCETLRMEKVETTGENPGWIYDHKAKLSLSLTGEGRITISGGTVYEVSGDKENFRDNTQLYSLDLTILSWNLKKNPDVLGALKSRSDGSGLRATRLCDA